MADLPDFVRGALARARLAIDNARKLDKPSPRPDKETK